jgi:hypothetical protein
MADNKIGNESEQNDAQMPAPDSQRVASSSVKAQMTLSQEAQAQIRLEEIFRAEVRESLGRGHDQGNKWISALNAPFTLFFLSSVIVAYISFRYNEHQQAEEKRTVVSTEARKVLYEMEHRSVLLDKELRDPQSWTKNLIKTSFFNMQVDPVFAKCDLVCLGNRLLGQSWSEDLSTRNAMRDAQSTADAFEEVVLRIAPTEDPAPLSSADLSELRRASTAMRVAIAKCYLVLDGTVLAVTQSYEGAPVVAIQASDIVGSWKSITNIWHAFIRSEGDKFVMYDTVTRNGPLRSPEISAELRSMEGKPEFSGRHMWRSNTESYWGEDGGMRVTLLSKDHIRVVYLDSKYKGGWDFIRDRMADPLPAGNPGIAPKK